jgi:glycosyltransferase involved in cell wall biosynthesis
LPEHGGLRIQYLVAAAGIPACGPSGASAHVRGITAGLAGLGHELELIAAASSDTRGELEAPSVPWQASGVATWPRAPRSLVHRRELRTARAVADAAIAAARRGPPVDLVIERHALFSDAGVRVARKLGVPLVLEVNAPQRLERERFEGGLSSGPAARWERRVLRSADTLVAVSSWLCRWLVDEVGCDRERVKLLCNGTAGHEGDRARGRAQAGLDPSAWVLGFVGAFRPWHGLDHLPELLEALPEATLLMVGAGRPAERSLWLALADHPRVVMVGRQPQAALADLVAAMDLGLAPYPADAPPWFCPLKVLDYRAQGTPVVAADLSDCRALVGDAGTIVTPGDVPAMAAAAQAWRGRRCAPAPRPWSDVARELLQAATPATGAVGNSPHNG